MAWTENRAGRKCYLACWKQNGKKIVKSTGIPIGSGKVEQRKNKQIAQQVADSMEAAATGQNLDKALDAVRAAAESNGMCSKLPTIREYLASIPATTSESSEKNRRRSFKVFTAYLGADADKRIDSITYNQCRDFIREQLRQVSKKTVTQYHTYISKAFADAQDIHGLISRNPMRPVSVAQESKQINPETGGYDKQERQAFTPSEMHRLLTEAPRPWRDIVGVSFYLGGMRIADVCLLRWDSINLTERRIILREEKTKRMRIASIIPQLYTILTEIKEAQGGKEEYVFPMHAHKFLGGSRSTVSTTFTALLQTMGIIAAPVAADKPTGRRKRISAKSFHSIRHAAVSFARSLTQFSRDVIRDTVGHEDERVEQGYFHSTEDQRRAVISALASIVDQAGTLPSYDSRTA